ncbi:MAG TPA: hypothetical protein VMB03_03810 [Bryobacteraceae bacterium]|nr:hypothetical protein [Bryobacteraceae bacterium]
MTPAPATAHLDRARSGIREALAAWDAADLSRVEKCCQLLSTAVGDLRVFESAVRTGEVPASDEVCSTLMAVKMEVVAATRVVDACVAFHRGLAARTGEAPPVYNADGCLAEESEGLESEVHA